MTARLSLTGFLLALVLALATCSTPVPTATALPTVTPILTPTATPVPGERQEATVLRVVDGDTIVVDLEGRQYSVRYIGIDTPETHHPTDGADYWGFEASAANKSVVKEGSTVVLQRDISETDIYDRLLRYVWVGDTLVNAELVRMGLARVLFYEPDVLYEHEIKEAEAEAQAARRGLYGPVPTPPAESPLLYKGSAWTAAPSGSTVGLRFDPARGEPAMSFPTALKVRVVDAFWVPEAQEWWYWIGVNGFNGWVTGAYIARDAPAAAASGPPATWEAYDRLLTVEEAVLYALPAAGSDAGKVLAVGVPVQVKGLSWEESSETWWYYVESADGQGWVQSDRLGR
jgi:endonuclease YncB( thermonuclease family)